MLLLNYWRELAERGDRRGIAVTFACAWLVASALGRISTHLELQWLGIASAALAVATWATLAFAISTARGMRLLDAALTISAITAVGEWSSSVVLAALISNRTGWLPVSGAITGGAISALISAILLTIPTAFMVWIARSRRTRAAAWYATVGAIALALALGDRTLLTRDSGQVTDDRGNPIPRAPLFVDDGAHVARFETDSTGGFRVHVDPSRRRDYRILFCPPGLIPFVHVPDSIPNIGRATYASEHRHGVPTDGLVRLTWSAPIPQECQ